MVWSLVISCRTVRTQALEKNQSHNNKINTKYSPFSCCSHCFCYSSVLKSLLFSTLHGETEDFTGSYKAVLMKKKSKKNHMVLNGDKNLP